MASYYANDVHHRLSTRIRDIIPDFVESEYPAFVSFVTAYYKFLEQYDDLPIASTYTEQAGVVTVRAGNSTILGATTQFNNTSIYANNIQFRVGSDQFRIRSVANNTQLIVYEIPVRSYFANTHTVETNKSTRQAGGALRQLLSLRQVDETLDDFIGYFRNTYLQDIPQGLTDTSVLLPRILDFYQARGSEASYNFLFRALYGKEATFSYPRDSVFTTSDNEWVYPVVLRLDYANNASIVGNVALLETREIVGLTTNTRATVLQTVVAHEGSRRVVRMFVSEPIIPIEPGNVLLESGDQLILTKYGVPPEGLNNIVYAFTLMRDEVTSSTFQPGEAISTIPTNDPDAITGNLLGTITGFNIESRGAEYQLGEFVYPPARYANGAVFTGGFGGLGRINAFVDVDLTSITIDNPGLGYYAGLPLIVDNGGTGGGTGLAGYVSAVAPGNLLLHNGDILTFTDNDSIDYQASRETINYYEQGISLADVFGGLQLDSNIEIDDGDDLLDEVAGRQLLQEAFSPDGLLSGSVEIGGAVWSNTSGAALFGSNLATTIIGLTSNLSVLPLYVGGVRTAVGKVYQLVISSFGAGYVAGLPTVGAQLPDLPTSDITGLDPLTYPEIFGAPFDAAEFSVNKEVGQIGSIDVVKGGSGYSNASFYLTSGHITYPILGTDDGANTSLSLQLDGPANEDEYLLGEGQSATYSTTTSTTSGNGAKVSLTLGAVSRGEPYFRTTRSFASADQYMQDITKYQPFSYALSIEEDLSRYSDVLRRLLHPAGGLLLPTQTITTEVDLVATITLESMNSIIPVSTNTITPSAETASV